MAAGAFIQGASIELSADAPMREPYPIYMQGGLTYESGKTGIMLAVDQLLELMEPLLAYDAAQRQAVTRERDEIERRRL